MHVFWHNGGLVWWPDSAEEAETLDANTKDLQTGRPKELEPASAEEIAAALGVEGSFHDVSTDLGVGTAPILSRDAGDKDPVIRIRIAL